MLAKRKRQFMKRGLSFMRMLVLTCLCVGMIFGADMTAQASGEIIFHVENQTGKAGDVVNVPVELTSNEEVGGFEIVVYYDSEAMTFQSLKKGSLIEEGDGGLFDYYHNEEKSSVKIVYVVADTVKAKGTIVDMKFKLKKDCGEALPLGMGVTQMVDNSDVGENIISEADVTGVDVEYQKQLEPQITSEGGNAGTSYLAEEQPAANTDKAESEEEERSGDTSADEKQDAKTDHDSADQSEDKKDEKQDDSGKNAVSVKKSQEKAEKAKAEETSSPVSTLIAVCVGIAVVAGAAIAVVVVRKNKNSKEKEE